MKNLAGNVYATEKVKNELERCGINIISNPDHRSEVPSKVMGQLGNFTFKRAWYYYVVTGKVPLNVAEQLYENKVGQTDIRVDGHCGCPPPELPWITYYDKNGNRLVPRKEIQDVENMVKYDNIEFLKVWLSKARCIDEVEFEDRQGFVESYHIDSELGLYIFVQTLKRENLV